MRVVSFLLLKTKHCYNIFLQFELHWDKCEEDRRLFFTFFSFIRVAMWKGSESSFSHLDTNRERIIAEGGAEVILELLQSSDLEVQRNAAKLLRSVSVNGTLLFSFTYFLK
jgi:hypothetical protein